MPGALPMLAVKAPLCRMPPAVTLSVSVFAVKLTPPAFADETRFSVPAWKTPATTGNARGVVVWPVIFTFAAAPGA